tara:strand:+ start:664 stop:1332 length:669 start_codon:yes stop_codon:yes gene_type:complete
MPVSNQELIELIKDQIDIFLTNYEIVNEEYYLSSNKQRMLAVYGLEGEGVDRSLPLSIAIKNSYDKSTAAAIGSGVQISHGGRYCGMWLRGSDITLFRKHTKYIKPSLSSYIAKVLDTSESRYRELITLCNILKRVKCSEVHAFSLFGLARGYGIIGSRSMNDAYRNWARQEDEHQKYLWDVTKSILGKIENSGDPMDMMESSGEIGDLIEILPDIFKMKKD